MQQLNYGSYMSSLSLPTNSFKFEEPVYYHREYANDIAQQPLADPWVDTCKRVGQTALPFISLCKPLSFPISLGMGAMRTYTCASQLYQNIQGGANAQEIAYQILQTTIAVISLAGTVFAHPIGMLISTGHDLIIELSQLVQHLQAGEYERAIFCCLSILNNALYLVMFLSGGIELAIASLVLQILVGLYSSISDFTNDRYIEGVGHILMAVVRGGQVAEQAKALQTKWEIEAKAAEKKAQLAASRQTATKKLLIVKSAAANQSDMALTEKVIKTSNPELIDILIKYGNNPDGIPALHYAIKQGDFTATKLLLDHGADPNAKISKTSSYHDWTPNRAIDYAAQTANVDILNLLIDRGALVNLTQDEKTLYRASPLAFAAMANNLPAVQILVARGAEVVHSPFNGSYNFSLLQQQPLYHAVLNGSVEIAKYLVAHGADINNLMYSEHPLLSTAAKGGKDEMVEFLISCGADVNQNPNYGENPLRSALQGDGHASTVRILLDHGAKFDTGYGSVWFQATHSGNIEIIEEFLAHGVDVNTYDAKWGGALCAASVNGHLNVVKFLVQKGADVNLNQPLQAALKHPDILEYLIDSGATITNSWGGGSSLLHQAAEQDCAEAIHVLMKKGANIHATDGTGRTPLHAACHSGRKNVILALLERGASVNAADKQGMKPLSLLWPHVQADYLHLLKEFAKRGASLTEIDVYPPPLHKAAWWGHKDVIQFLIDEQKLNVNAALPDGRTPFFMAFYYTNDISVLDLLLKKGANINAKTKDGQTALSYAQLNKQHMVKWLIEHGAK